MKVISPTVIALVLWFLFFASHAFAVFKSPYPTKAQPPDSIIILATTALVPSPARQVNQSADENWHQTSANAAFAFQRKTLRANSPRAINHGLSPAHAVHGKSW